MLRMLWAISRTKEKVIPMQYNKKKTTDKKIYHMSLGKRKSCETRNLKSQNKPYIEIQINILWLAHLLKMSHKKKSPDKGKNRTIESLKAEQRVSYKKKTIELKLKILFNWINPIPHLYISISPQPSSLIF